MDEIYGPSGIIHISNLGRITIEYLRRYASSIPAGRDLLSFWPFPLRADRFLTPDFSMKLAENIADWGYAVASFNTDQDLSRLLDAVSKKRFPVIAVTALGDSGVQLMMRTDATSEETWTAAYEELRAEFAKLGAIAPEALYAEGVALPGFYPGCEFVYVNFDVANNPRG